jgi:hypothetical protein
MPTLISGSTGVNKITDGTITNADIASGAAIAGTKLVMPTGSVLQVVTSEDGGPSSTSSTSFVQIHSFSISNVLSTSTVHITAAISHLIEGSGSGGYVVEKSDGTVIAKSQHGTGGNGSWRMILPTLIGKDTSPSAGTNTYIVKMASSGQTIYYNYWPTTNFNTRSFYQTIEVAG